MTGAAPVVVRTVVVAGLALLLRAELWLPLASALGLLAVMARRRWLHQRRWLPAQVALVALVDSASAVDRPSDALMASVAAARDRQQLIERAAAQLRRRGHEDWATGSEQLGLAGHVAEALPGDDGAAGRLLIVALSAAVGVLAVVLRLHPGVFVGAFIAGLVAGTDLREECRWRPAMLAARSVRAGQHELDDLLPIPGRLALLAGSRRILERAHLVLSRARVPAQQLDLALSAVEDALVSLRLIDRPSRSGVLRHLPGVTAAWFVLWVPL